MQRIARDSRLVLHCQNVAKSMVMQTTDEPQINPAMALPEPAAPEASASRGDTETGRPDSSVPAQMRGAADLRPEWSADRPREIGGRDGPEPTRFGDWEKAGRCIDF